MISKYLITLISITVFLFLIMLVINLFSRKEKTMENGKEGKPLGRWNFLQNLPQGWNAKKIAKWAFGIFLLFELVVLLFDSPNFSLVRKLADIAYRNNPAHTTENIKQTAMEEEIKPFREELDIINNLEKPNYQNYVKSKELEKKIGNIEAKYDPAKRSAGLQKRRLSRALLGDIYINLKSEGYSTSARITRLDEQQLSISCVLSDKGFLGSIEAEWSEEQKCYMGTWAAPYKKGQIKLVPFSDSLGLVYRLDGTHKNDDSDKWMELTITHRRDYEGSASNVAVSCKS